MKTGCGSLFVTINQDDQGDIELFAKLGKSGGCAGSQTEAVGRLVSLAFRLGADPNDIIKQLRGIRCPAPMFDNGAQILSCSDAIGHAIRLHTDPGEESPSIKLVSREPIPIRPVSVAETGMNPQCPECNGLLELQEGCAVCRGCGYSRCG